jgi:alkylhydroperoxidase family enzyme
MTWLPLSQTSADSDLDNVLAHQPRAGRSLKNFLSVAEGVNDSALLHLCRLRLAQLMNCRAQLAGVEPGLLQALESWKQSKRFTALEKAALDYAEQFMVGANNISASQRDNLARELGVGEPSTFVYGLYINEGFLRLLTFFDIDPYPPNWLVPASRDLEEKSDREHIEWVEGQKSETDSRLMAAYYDFNLATCSQHGVDETTDEVVRLRSAEYHDCKFCQSVRRVLDLPEGVDDLMAEVRHYEKSTALTGQQKTALAVLDTFVASPAQVDENLKSRILAHFSPAQIVELLLKEVFWMSNKPMISLGTDPGPVSPEATTPFEYDREGNFAIL